MTKILLIAQREVKHFFQTPFAMVIVTMYLVLCGVYFNLALDSYLALTNPSEAGTSVSGVTVNSHLLMSYFKDIFNVLCFFTPLITMRSFAEEKKLATYDLLISYPVKPWETLLGKYLGSATLVLFLLALSCIHLTFVFLKSDVYMPLVYTTYLGYVLFILFYVAAGIVASLMTENQIVAAIITYLALLGTTLLQWLAYVTPAPWDKLFANFLLLKHLDSFRMGIVFLGDIVVYLGMTACLLLLGELKIRRHFVR